MSQSTVPQTLGAYSQVMRVSDLVFVSGQIPLSPEGELIQADFPQQARYTFEQLAILAELAGGDINSIVKLTVHLTNLDNMPVVNALMEELLSDPYPARMVAEVSRLPKDAPIALEAVLHLGQL